MGLLAEIALFFCSLIGIYAGLHDFLGVNIIPYSFFDTFLAPAFVSFLFILITSIVYWIYRVSKRPLKKKALQLLKLSIFIIAMGIFFSALPPEASSSFKLLVGKLLQLSGIALVILSVRLDRKLGCSSAAENKDKEHQYT